MSSMLPCSHSETIGSVYLRDMIALATTVILYIGTTSLICKQSQTMKFAKLHLHLPRTVELVNGCDTVHL